ncbi:MAG TPA: hypothetical protein VE974_04765 [Thermoanaerobaculia bacterium]|nr:hypothetical protein [Thermoanaerobaculia bacterium]
MRQLARDPFARTTLVRVIVRPLAHGRTCSWCGSVRTSRKGGTPYLYRYGTEPDAARPRIHWHDGAFCSKSCHDAYRH